MSRREDGAEKFDGNPASQTTRLGGSFASWVLTRRRSTLGGNALLTIPILIIQESDLSQPWQTIGAVLNWGTWLRTHILDLAIAVLTPALCTPACHHRGLREMNRALAPKKCPRPDSNRRRAA
jgi:hypothetical protein